jgi:hypothetical protein
MGRADEGIVSLQHARPSGMNNMGREHIRKIKLQMRKKVTWE